MIHRLSVAAGAAAIMLLFSGCYSVFSGGTGGMVVDSESTDSPKSGIANVEVYAYTDENSRNSDYESWIEGTVFSPSGSYYNHTSTGSDGSFTISRLVWKNNTPEFGKDADVTKIYLLFYHENYGLTKGATVIVSDSTSDTIYQELTAVRKTTSLNISFVDVATDSVTSNSIYVTVAVPQSTDTLTAPDKIYRQTISGSGSVSISYPRWRNSDDRASEKEIEPEVRISYYQSGDEITWKACSNADNDAADYSFLADGTEIKKTVRNQSYDIRLYGKPTKLSVPSFSGQYVNSGDEKDDGLVIALELTGSYDGAAAVDCGTTTTESQAKGTTEQEKHGVFSGLGSGYYWKDTDYKGKYAEASVKFFLGTGDGRTELKQMDIRSDSSSYNVQLP